jgi:hypothetical protein
MQSQDYNLPCYICYSELTHGQHIYLSLYALILLLGGEWMIKKPLMIISLVAFVALIGGYAFYPGEYRKNFAKLERTCTELTKNDSNGRKYEPIVGRYVKKKSYITMDQGDGPTRFSHQITLINNKKEITSFSEVMTTQENYKKYTSIVNSVVEIPEWRGPIEYTEETYGLCGFRNSSNKYIANIETLQQIGE